ncbi:MAG TPA: nitrous oxide reductase accessory protein NosL [Chitinophagaceae bacterium]
MNKLSKVSRLLVAFASIVLVAVYFVPAWRIDLFAPQYPEGLVMKIWINDITGDVEVINGLNHYIGMKHITVDMFPEFTYLPFVVAFFIAFGLLVAILGSRKLLLAYLVLTVIGGVAAIYDFYQWGYDYGHNLDPKAPIQVPGFSYQPPVIGHKRLLNFDAYSFPDIGGYIVIIAAMLAFTVWFFEWFRGYKTRKRTKPAKMKAVVAVAAFVVLMSACDTNPVPFELGKDVCSNCRMTIVDPKFGGEVITKKGKVYKFDDVRCMSQFLKTGTVGENDIRHQVVVDYSNVSQFLDINTAFFITSPGLKSPMGSNTAAFASAEASQKLNINGEAGSWNDLKEKFK